MSRYSEASLVMVDLRQSDKEIEAQLGVRRPIMPAHWKPRVKVGDTVVLNRFGLMQIFGNTTGLSHMRTLKMRVTHVDSDSITENVPTFFVQVDNPDFDPYLIDDLCFDVVKD